MRIAAVLFATLAVARVASAVEPTFTKSGDGPGPSVGGNVIRLLTGGEREVNSLTLPASSARPVESFEVRGNVKLDPGGDGFGILIVNADFVGNAEPVESLDLWEEPNRADAIGIGFDARNPPSDDAFDANGNLYDRPQREMSVHVDGREVRNRQSADFATGAAVPVYIRVEFVAGGARMTARVGQTNVYENELLPGVRPFAPRVAIGARAGGKVKLELAGLDVKVGPVIAAPFAVPKRVTLFQKATASVATTREPTAIVSFADVPKDVARVIATIKLEAPPAAMDKWDRRGALYLYADDRQRYEVARFVTPFAREVEWQADVTDFLPLLRDDKKFGLFVDTWRDGFLVSATLDFYEGKPERLPIAVMNLWQGEPIIGDAKMPVAAFFDGKTIIAPKDATSAVARIVATGHGQFPNSKNAGEFLGLHRTLGVNGHSFKDHLWTTDNYLNPCRPQAGTWKYDRAGWGPGRLATPWTVDLTPLLTPKRELTLTYAIDDEYKNENVGKGDPPTHWIDGHVIFYK